MLLTQPEIQDEAAPDETPALSSVAPQQRTALAILGGLWLLLFFASLFSPPLLDDADATHANAARHIVLTGDWVTLHVNGIRYLEKAPLPYWLVAISFKIFGFNTFATHLPEVIAVLLLTLLGYAWSLKAFGSRTAFYTGLATLTAVGVFLFTRIFIPEALLALFLALTLYCLLRALEGGRSIAAYTMWIALACAVLTKGLVALIFFAGATIVYLILSGDFIHWRTLKPFTGLLLFLTIAAPWHILAGLRNTGGMDGHGFFWFYFVNEHALRFLGQRIPMDYNKLPGYLYWSLHFVWLFPWSLLVPALAVQAFVAFRTYLRGNPPFFDFWPTWMAYAVAILGILLRNLFHVPYLLTVAVIAVAILLVELVRRQQAAPYGTPLIRVDSDGERTILLLTVFSALVVGFFSLSTNQEYYTFPAYLPLLMLLMQAVVRAESFSSNRTARAVLIAGHAAFTLAGLACAAALLAGLWTSRHLPFVPDIGDLLAHRNVGEYTLSMSHLFDLTGPSFAALRLPAILAAFAFALGPAVAWLFRQRRHHLTATSTIAVTSALFLIAAHIALFRFSPMLSSQDLAEKIQELEDDRAITPEHQVLIYGDQAFGSSIPFYLGQNVLLVEGRSTSMLFGSTFPDAPKIFLTNADLSAQWGHGERKLLFVPLERRNDVDRLLGKRQIVLEETSGKALITDRPLDRASSAGPVEVPAVFPSLHALMR